MTPPTLPSPAPDDDKARRAGRRAWTTAIVVLLSALGLGAAFLNLVVERQNESAHTRARELGTAQAHFLEKRLDQLFVATSALATVLRQGGDVNDFAALAGGILETSPGLSAVILARRGQTPEVYPPRAAEGAAEWLAEPPGDEGAASARLRGPERLSDGGLAVYGVTPVEAAGQPWGHVTAALRLGDLVRESRLEGLRQDRFEYQLTGIDAEGGRERVLVRSTELGLEAPQEFPISYPGGRWTLSVAPRDGWPSWRSSRLHVGLTAVLALIAAIAAFELAKQPERLRAQVHRSSDSLRKTKHRLNTEIRQRALAEARAIWQGLNRFSRLAFVAAGRPSDPEGASEGTLVRTVGEALKAVGSDYRTDEIRAGISRLEEQGLLDRDEFGRLRVARPVLLSLPEAGRPLTELARESLEKIGPFRIERRIGGGGMGEVFRAQNVDDGSRVAVKLLYPQAIDDQEHRQRFEREGDMVAQLDHPNIVKLHDRGEHKGRLYIAMELVEGTTLESTLEESGSLKLSESLAILRDVAKALAALHDLGLVHRDVKSSNVMRTPSGRTVLLDFGLASRMASQALTRSDTILGTVPYMAPERLLGERGTPHVDVWSAGLLLYEMLLGRLPWKNPNDLSLVNEILGAQNLPIAARVEPIAGAEVVRLLGDMLAYMPRHRLPDGAALLARLREIIGEQDPSDELSPSARLDATLIMPRTAGD